MADVHALPGLTKACVQASLLGVPVDPAVKSAGARVLTHLLAPEDPQDDCGPFQQYSLLTPSGFPVEMAFGNPSQELRFTTEVGGQSPPHHTRLALAEDRLHAIGHRVHPIDLAWCSDLQSSHRLSYGAWVSMRLGPSLQASKLYVESPLEAHGLALAQLHAPGNLAEHLHQRGARVTMIGLPEGGDPEFYFGVNGLRLNEIPDLFARLGQFDAGKAVISALETLSGRFLNTAIRQRQTGISLKQLHGGGWLMSVFFQAADLYASGSQTRRSLLRAATSLQCDLSAYEQFSQDVAEETDDDRHCMLALTPLPNGRVDLRVGLGALGPNGPSCGQNYITSQQAPAGARSAPALSHQQIEHP